MQVPRAKASLSGSFIVEQAPGPLGEQAGLWLRLGLGVQGGRPGVFFVPRGLARRAGAAAKVPWACVPQQPSPQPALILVVSYGVCPGLGWGIG